MAGRSGRFPELADSRSVVDPDALLTDNGTCVVVGIHEMNGRTGFRLTAGKHRFEHPIPKHALPSEFGEQRRMGVQNPRCECG